LTLSPQVARNSTAKPALIEFGLTISSVAALAEAGSHAVARSTVAHDARMMRSHRMIASKSGDRLMRSLAWGNYRHFVGS
jgi:hypothetical protein